jgi:hypothetical protein
MPHIEALLHGEERLPYPEEYLAENAVGQHL